MQPGAKKCRTEALHWRGVLGTSRKSLVSRWGYFN